MKPSTLRVPTEPAHSTDPLDLSRAVRVTLPNLKLAVGPIASESVTLHPAPQEPSAHHSLPEPTARHTPAQSNALGPRPIRKSSPERAAQMHGEEMK